MEILFQSYTAYSRYIEWYDSLTSEETLAVVQSHPSSPPPPAPPTHLPREWDSGNQNAARPWSMRGWGQEIPWERGWFRAWWLWRHMLRYDAAWETAILYQFEFLFLHCRSGADFVVCSLFGVLYFRLEIYLSVSGFGFAIFLVCFFLGICICISGFWVFALYYGHKSD